MKLSFLAAWVLVVWPLVGVAQSSAERETLVCEPVPGRDDPLVRVSKESRQTVLALKDGDEWRTVLVLANDVQMVRYAPEARVLFFFRDDTKHGKWTGWQIMRIGSDNDLKRPVPRDGKIPGLDLRGSFSVEAASSHGPTIRAVDIREAPYAACVSADGTTLAAVTWESEAVQIDMRPAIARAKVWDGSLPDDRKFVPRKPD